MLARSLARQLTWRVLATPAGIREALLPSMHPNQGPLVRHRVRVPRTQGQARGGQGGRVPALRLPRLRQRRLIHQRTSLAPSLSVQSRTQPAHPPPRTAVQHATLLHKRRATAAAATTRARARQHRSIDQWYAVPRSATLHSNIAAQQPGDAPPSSIASHRHPPPPSSLARPRRPAAARPPARRSPVSARAVLAARLRCPFVQPLARAACLGSECAGCCTRGTCVRSFARSLALSVS